MGQMNTLSAFRHAQGTPIRGDDSIKAATVLHPDWMMHQLSVHFTELSVCG
jgi:hypothetical protein